jgi:hypothetical protein
MARPARPVVHANFFPTNKLLPTRPGLWLWSGPSTFLSFFFAFGHRLFEEIKRVFIAFPVIMFSGSKHSSYLLSSLACLFVLKDLP